MHHWYQHGERSRSLRFFVHQHLRDQDYKGLFLPICAHEYACITKRGNEITVRTKNLPLLRQCTVHHAAGQPVLRQMIDENNGVHLCVCAYVCLCVL